MDGSMVNEVFYKDKDLKKIAEYCVGDVSCDRPDLSKAKRDEFIQTRKYSSYINYRMSKKKLKKTKEKKERKTRREKSADFKRRPSSAGPSKNQSNKNQNSRSVVIEGTVDHVHPRFGYIITGIEGQKDIYVKTPDLNTALHGDRVEVELKKDRSGGNPEGRVINIIKRARTRFVGRVEITKNYAFVVPDFKKIYQDFLFT